MDTTDAIILGLIQGITEFLPISSSGHLKLGELILGMHDLQNYVVFDLVCHFGTLFSIFCVFYKDLIHLLTQDRRTLLLLFLATLPLAPLYFLLHSIKAMYGLPQYLGFFFLLTAGLLYASERFTRPAPAVVSPRRQYLEALFIGCFQAVALLPAVSRSGSTMAAARFLGWDRVRAARFSFFLAIPTILAGIALETLNVFRGQAPSVSISPLLYGIGFIISFLVGWAVIKALLTLLKTMTLKPFACYCLVIGIFALVYTHFILGLPWVA